MNKTLVNDPELDNIIDLELKRQKEGLELIASENFTSVAVMECLGSILTNKYSEGLPGKRYYGGNQYIDLIENLCKKRALLAYRLKDSEWGINVQPYSGSVANLGAYLGILKPHDRIMGLSLSAGGHLTHGHYTEKRKVSATSIIFESLSYGLNKDGFIDYDDLEKTAKRFKPKLIICGSSAYSRDFDYKRFRQIADINNSYLLCDMAHISGLVASQLLNNPFEYCDIVTTTTHKTMRGPRAGIIFFKKELEKQINFSVFPGLQGGPHNNKIAGIATQLLEVNSNFYRNYCKQIVKNCKTLCSELQKYGYTICTGGTDCHLILVNLNPLGITGSKIEKICEVIDISINKNSVIGDKSAYSPGGIRIGTPALTTRGLKEKDFIKVAEFIHKAIQLALEIQLKSGKKLKDFNNYLYKNTNDNHSEFQSKIIQLREEVNLFASQFEFYK